MWHLPSPQLLGGPDRPGTKPAKTGNSAVTMRHRKGPLVLDHSHLSSKSQPLNYKKTEGFHWPQSFSKPVSRMRKLRPPKEGQIHSSAGYKATVCFTPSSCPKTDLRYECILWRTLNIQIRRQKNNNVPCSHHLHSANHR